MDHMNFFGTNTQAKTLLKRRHSITLWIAALAVPIMSLLALARELPGPRVGLTRAPYIQWTTPSSAHIVWNTDQASSTVVEYQLDLPRSTSQRVVKTMNVTRHIVKLTGLRAGSAYRYRVVSNGAVLGAGKFQTAKTAGQAFHFAVWGDSGTGSRGQHALAPQIEKHRPDFLLHTGDLIYNKGEAENYDARFFRVYAPTLARVPFYGSLGNHDVGTDNGQPFLDNFVLPPNGPPGLTPERNYSFDCGNAHFVVIDSNLSQRQLRRVIVPWLERDLGASNALWKFAVFHHPPYSSGLHGDESRTQRALAPALASLGVDIVFNGHDHGYERFRPRRGVVYIVTGAGGAGLYRRTRTDPMTAHYANSDHSFTHIAINGRTLQGRQIAASGAVLDKWSITK